MIRTFRCISDKITCCNIDYVSRKKPLSQPTTKYMCFFPLVLAFPFLTHQCRIGRSGDIPEMAESFADASSVRCSDCSRVHTKQLPTPFIPKTYKPPSRGLSIFRVGGDPSTTNRNGSDHRSSGPYSSFTFTRIEYTLLLCPGMHRTVSLPPCLWSEPAARPSHHPNPRDGTHIVTIRINNRDTKGVWSSWSPYPGPVII